VVNPILLIAVPLAVAFLLPLVDRLGRPAARAAHLLTLAFELLVAGQWFLGLSRGVAAAQIITGGWAPPLGINLRFGVMESVLVGLAALTAVGSAFYLAHHEEEGNLRGLVIQLLLFTGAVGLIMTRDLFNTFVFLEISGIGTYAIVVFGRERSALEAGFKYVALGSAASTFVLLGIAFLYKITGTLNLDDMIHKLPAAAVAGTGTVLLLLLVGLTAEAKLFPVNGPAIDLYQGVEPGVMALIVGTTVNAVLFVLWKVSPLYGGVAWGRVFAWVGMVTFLVCNVLAIRQKNLRRMLGYSSSAQIGLLVFLVPFVRSGEVMLSAAALLLVNHTLAKAGLLWLAGTHGGERIEDWRGAFPDSVALRITLAVGVLAMTGFPPFPGFWGKWQALVGLAGHGHGWWVGALLAGSLFELVYYFRWLKQALAPAVETSRGALRTAFTEVIAPLAFAGIATAFGLRVLAASWGGTGGLAMALVFAGLALVFVRALPERLKAAVVLAVLGRAGWVLVAGSRGCPLWDLRGFFLVLTLFGAAVIAVAGLGLAAERGSFWGLFLILVGSVVAILLSSSLLAFFAGWELMTWSSYLLVSQGRRGAPAGYLYILFSGAAGFLVLGGFMVAESAGVSTLSGLAALGGGTALAAWSLVAAGFAVKVASWGVHIWAPGAYSEAPDLFTPFLSGVISKVPVFGLAAVAAGISAPVVRTAAGALQPAHVLGWVGGLTAFGMTLLAVFQEDMKKLLAYSSVGQVGYVVLGVAVMTPLGWTAALYYAVNHMLFKGLLFLAVAGVIARTGTRTFAEVGGLIKRMPASFIAVLIGIIALAGVPPLSGFAGKWLLYEALMDKGWLFLTAFMMFASVIAFLYCFRLIHSIFLGQLKRAHRQVKEAPWPLLLAELMLIVPIMVLSVRPQVLLEPVQRLVTGILGAPGLHFASASTMTTGFGSLNATAMMALVVVLFVVLLVFLLTVGPKPRKVGQLDIVYSAEVPPPPEEIQYAWAFYRPYERAFGLLLKARVTAFWRGAADVAEAVADAGRRFYTGNAQTYVLYSVLFILALVAFGLGR